jgi:hypothetical protein
LLLLHFPRSSDSLPPLSAISLMSACFERLPADWIWWWRRRRRSSRRRRRRKRS